MEVWVTGLGQPELKFAPAFSSPSKLSRCNSLGRVTNRRTGFCSGILASTTTTNETFLCASIPATSIASFPGVEAAERTQKKFYTVTCYHPTTRRVARHRLLQNARSGSSSKTASLHPECKQIFAVQLHQRTRATPPHFHVNGWATGPMENENPEKGDRRSKLVTSP